MKLAKRDGLEPRREMKLKVGAAGFLWCRDAQMVDAEEHYKKKIISKSAEIRDLKAIRLQSNCGYGFVSFASNLEVKRLQYDFKKLADARLPDELKERACIQNWRVSKAPVASDIIWENMMNDETIASFKSWILLVVLFFVCVVFITPTFLVDNLGPIIDALEKEIGRDSIFSVALQTFFAPLMVLAFNSGLLPLFIDFIAYLEGHKSKSQRQIGIMRKNFFFQSFNIIFLQLMGQTVILSALKELSN